MHVFLKNKKIVFLDYKLKCSIGKRGISKNKKEGDKRTPSGNFTFKKVFYRKDRIPFIETDLQKIILKKDMGWCDDINSSKYNKLISFPFKKKAERLFRKDSSYDIIITLDHNTNPTIKNKGSAIFFHLAKKNYSPTKGCVALSKKDLVTLIKNLKKNSKIKIY